LKQSVTILIILFILCISLPGCGGQKEINRLAIVMAAAIDPTGETNNIDFTIQIANPASVAGGDSGGDKDAFSIVTGSGPTLGEAERDLYTRLPRLVYWNNMQVIIISAKLAQNKMDSIIDYLDRPTVFRRNMHLVVTSGNAKDALAVKHLTEKMSGIAIANIQKTAFKHSKTVYPSDIHDFLLDLSDDGVEPILARLEIQPSPESKEDQKKTDNAGKQELLILSGSAVFKNTKMVGWLNGAETRGALWVWGEMRQGVLTFKYPHSKSNVKLITVLNQRAESKIAFKIKNGKPQMTVIIKAEGRLSGLNFKTNETITDPHMIEALDHEYAQAVKAEVRTTLAKVQTEYVADIFGFGDVISRRRPKLWKKLKPHWDVTFRKLHVNVEVEAHIRRIGLTMGPTNSL
jgi:spore germination protein KC